MLAPCNKEASIAQPARIELPAYMCAVLRFDRGDRYLALREHCKTRAVKMIGLIKGYADVPITKIRQTG